MNLIASIVVAVDGAAGTETVGVRSGRAVRLAVAMDAQLVAFDHVVMRGGPLDNHLVTLSHEIHERGRWALDIVEWPGEYVRDPIVGSEWCWVTPGASAANEAETMDLLMARLAFEFQDLPMLQVVDAAVREYNRYATVQERDVVIAIVEARAREVLSATRAPYGSATG